MLWEVSPPPPESGVAHLGAIRVLHGSWVCLFPSVLVEEALVCPCRSKPAVLQGFGGRGGECLGFSPIVETAEGSRQCLGALRLCRVSVWPSPSPEVGGGLSAGQLLPAQGVGGFGGPALGTGCSA